MMLDALACPGWGLASAAVAISPSAAPPSTRSPPTSCGFAAARPGLLAELRARTTARLHGSCIGAGPELQAFAGRVVADPGATLRLPELSMGLVPGAGGTVSVTSRIGQWRTAWLVVSGQMLMAEQAALLGLVDEVSRAWRRVPGATFLPVATR
jgi:hypothetical protein